MLDEKLIALITEEVIRQLTANGRVVLPDAYRHLDYPVPVTVQQERLEV